MTGGAAVYGSTQRNGVQLAVEELNAQSGITYELVVEYDSSDPAQGITAFEKLINQDQVSVIIGPTLSNTAFSADPIAQDGGVRVLAVSNTAAGITEIGEFIFRNSLTEAQVIPQTIGTAAAALGIERVAVLYGTTILLPSLAQIRAHGTTVLLVEQNAHRALRAADYGYVMDSGGIVLEGDASQLLSNERVVEAYLGEVFGVEPIPE